MISGARGVYVSQWPEDGTQTLLRNKTDTRTVQRLECNCVMVRQMLDKKASSTSGLDAFML